MHGSVMSVHTNDNDPAAERPHMPRLFVDDEERTVPLARDVLAGAHTTMTAEEIAAHALDLAQEVTLARWWTAKFFEDILYRSPQSPDGTARVKAFEDFWRWGTEADNAMNFIRAIGSPAYGV